MIPISKLIRLVEKRSHSELNPKISGYAALEKYMEWPHEIDNNDLYISYTSIPKIGVNPKTPYNTPLGIYAYPLAEVFTSLYGSSKGVAFGGDRPYIFVLRSKNKSKFVEDMYSDYGSADYDGDMDKLRTLYKDAEIHDPNPDIDPVLRNIEDVINYGTANAKDKNSISSMWNVTRLLAITLINSADVPEHEKWWDNNIGAAAKWNSILRKLGYTGFCDRSGHGIIHPAEPVQAVFLTKDAFEVVDMLKNINPKIANPNLTKMFKITDKHPNTMEGVAAALDRFPWLKRCKFKNLEVHIAIGTLIITGGTWLSGTLLSGECTNVTFRGGTIGKLSNTYDVEMQFCNLQNTIINGGTFIGNCLITNCQVKGGRFGDRRKYNNVPVRMRDCKISGVSFIRLIDVDLHGCTINGKRIDWYNDNKWNTDNIWVKAVIVDKYTGVRGLSTVNPVEYIKAHGERT